MYEMPTRSTSYLNPVTILLSIICYISTLGFATPKNECTTFEKTKMNDKKNLGQYFTPEDMAAFMLDLSRCPTTDRVLEPSSGEGVFLDLLEQRNFRNVVAYEIDEVLAKKRSNVICESFVSADIDNGFGLVIGNPPYIRWKNLSNDLKKELEVNPLWTRYFNALCDYSYIFMLKSVELLKEGGELIFICPEYWMNTTHSQTLRNYFLEHGYFTDFYIFNEAPIFKDATVSTVVFRFVKSKATTKPKMRIAKFTTKIAITKDILERLKERKPIKDVEYLEIPQFSIGERWAFIEHTEKEQLTRLMEKCRRNNDSLLFGQIITIGDICDIGNGMVSGLDKAFQLSDNLNLSQQEIDASLMVCKAKNLTQYYAFKPTRYINIPDTVVSEEDFQCSYPLFYEQMSPYKQKLNERYQYGKGLLPYWQWSFKRNEKLFTQDTARIFVPCKERISSKHFVRFALIPPKHYPTQDVTALFKKNNVLESLEYIVAYLNHPLVFKWIKNYGIVKGNIVEFSEKPLATIPFRSINWNSDDERKLHDEITLLVKELLQTHNAELVQKINQRLDELLK